MWTAKIPFAWNARAVWHGLGHLQHRALERWFSRNMRSPTQREAAITECAVAECSIGECGIGEFCSKHRSCYRFVFAA